MLEQENTGEKLKEHLLKEHKISPLSIYLREIVYGGTDGIVTTFAVVAGFAGAGGSDQISGIPMVAVVLFGLANLFADAASMGLGNFLSTRASQDVYLSERQKEHAEVRRSREQEIAETLHLLKDQGFSQNDAQKITELYAKNEKFWVEFMMKYELNLQSPLDENPYLTGLATFFSFIIFGTIPLLPYLLGASVDSAFSSALLSTLTALLILGLLRYRITKISLARSVGETLVLGTLAAAVAYFVGTFFRS